MRINHTFTLLKRQYQPCSKNIVNNFFQSFLMKAGGLLMLFFVAGTMVFAQDYKFGPMVGMKVSDMKPGNIVLAGERSGEEVLLSFREAKPEVFMGGFARIELDYFFVQPEILFSGRQRTFSIQQVELGQERPVETQVERSFSILTPLTLGVKLDYFRLQGGMTIQIPVKQNRFTAIGGYYKAVKESPVTFNAGVGADLGMFTLDMFYRVNWCLAKVTIIADNEIQPLAESRSQLTLSVGYLFE